MEATGDVEHLRSLRARNGVNNGIYLHQSSRFHHAHHECGLALVADFIQIKKLQPVHVASSASCVQVATLEAKKSRRRDRLA